MLFKGMQGGTLGVIFLIMLIKEGIVWGYYVKEFSFSHPIII
jgi:hypothetical protein